MPLSAAPASIAFFARIRTRTAAGCSSASSTPASIPPCRASVRPRRARPRCSTSATSPAKVRWRSHASPPTGDSVDVGGHHLGGFGRVAALSTAGPLLRRPDRRASPRRPAGGRPQSTTAARMIRLPVVVTRASDGWVLFADTDGDGSLAGEKPVHDYLTGRETFGWAPRGRKPHVTVAANFTEAAGQPAARPGVRHHRPWHPRLRHRGGPRHLRRRGVRRRRAGRPAARAQDRERRQRRHHDHRQHAARDDVRASASHASAGFRSSST